MRVTIVASVPVIIVSVTSVADAFFVPRMTKYNESLHRLEAKKNRNSPKVKKSSTSSSKGFSGSMSANAHAKESKPRILNDGTSEIYSDMISWLENNPLTYISPKFETRPSKLGGYGGFCSANASMKQGELIFRIPRECCVTFDDAVNDKSCGKFFRLVREKQIIDWSLFLIAGWTAKEYTMATLYSRKFRNEGIFNLQQLNSSINRRIKHWPYLQTLPWKRGVLNQDHVLFWSEEEIESLLKGSLSYDDAILIRSRVMTAIELMNDIAIGPLIEEMGLDESDTAGIDDLFDGLAEAVVGAYVIALSRSFAEEVEYDREDGKTGIEVEPMLLPMFDLLQHSNDPNTILESYDEYLIVKARRNIQPGEEVLNQYRGENYVPPHKFFTRYGFVPGVREPAINLLKKRSSIFFIDENAHSTVTGFPPTATTF